MDGIHRLSGAVLAYRSDRRQHLDICINYAAAHGLAIGRDVVWTTGPLGYLVFPQDVGANLVHALVFQGVLWAVLIVIFADLFYFAGVALRNLGFFTTLLQFVGPSVLVQLHGVENLLLAGVLVLLVLARLRGGFGRYVVALALAGVIPLIKLTGGLLALGAVLGFLADRIIRVRKQAWREIALAAGGAAGRGRDRMLAPAAILRCVRRDTSEPVWISSAATPAPCPTPETRLNSEGWRRCILCIAAFLFVRTRSDRAMVWFFVALLTIPLLSA